MTHIDPLRSRLRQIVLQSIISVSAALMLAMAPQPADAEQPAVQALPGKAILFSAAYDIASLGYETNEFVVSGSARSYAGPGLPPADGDWRVRPADSKPYKTRIIVVKPIDPRRFNGTVIVEWMNVSGGLDVPVEWINAHRELTRSGYAYIAVSAQKVGIDGGNARAEGSKGMFLKRTNPERYGILDHPGDAYAFDIFSDVGRLLRSGQRTELLGSLEPQRVLAAGESQSAFFLASYINAIDPIVRIFDGFLVHSRSAVVAPLDGSSMFSASDEWMNHSVRLRRKLRVPVLQIVTETDLIRLVNSKGFYAARQPDHSRLLTWEIAGSAHADNYLFGVGMFDAPGLPSERLAALWAPRPAMGQSVPGRMMNNGPQHHYVAQAAIVRLDEWVRSGRKPAHAAPIELANGDPPTVVADANGNAKGGVRTPWVDVPTSKLSGDFRDAASDITGSVAEFSPARLAQIYPGGKEEYMRRFGQSLDQSIAQGFILTADRAEILGLAALRWDASFSDETR